MDLSEVGTVRFGSKWSVVYTRLVQIFLGLVMLLFLPQRVEGFVAWVPIVLVAAIDIAMVGFVQAEATVEGIAFRRWMHWKVVPWNDVERVWQHPLTKQLVVKVSAKRLLTRYLLLSKPQPSLAFATKPGSPAARLKAFL